VNELHADLLVLGATTMMRRTPIASRCWTGSPIAFPSSTSRSTRSSGPLDDGHEALLVDAGGIDGGNGTYFANNGDDVHAVGTLDPIVEGYVGCIANRSVCMPRCLPGSTSK
jgi:hypothetical protein